MSAYILAGMNVEGRIEFERYLNMSVQAVKINNVKSEGFISEEPHLLDGELPAQCITVMKFKSLKDARKFYYSEAYQKAAFVRHGSARTVFSLVMEGEFTNTIS